MKLPICLFLVIFSFSLACKNVDKNNNIQSLSQKPVDTPNLETVSPTFLDTTIHLVVLKDQHSSNDTLTSGQARHILYSYFKRKGVLPRENVRISQDSLVNDLCVSYDTIYKIRTGTFRGSIVSYWLGPADLNGHCFQPSKAFIQVINHGFVVSNENFIRTNFTIDSSVGPYIYGYDYDCGGKGIIRQFKIKLE